eukprot:Pompholyxophrys_punicea_v1_NODE_378_length_2095_cov_23.619608.p1 type:complete len:497 gc:universal NODE_378_length_2095_cov_23.619608:1657-167(-)
MSAIDALALLVDCNLGKNEYQKIRNNALQHNIYLYPPYNDLRKEKEVIYPNRNSESITETSASTTLQSLVDITSKRLCEYLREPLNFVHSELLLISKWGFDGATGQSMYKQSWSFETTSTQDSSLFSTNLVPLRLICLKSNTVVWNNPCPSSVSFCRPLRIQFEKESKDLNISEKDHWENEIKNLNLSIVSFGEKFFSVFHRLLFTMIDGKVLGHITDTHTTNCPLCKATPSMMNNISYLQTIAVDDHLLEYGLSSMHLWIRALEYMWNIARKLEVQKGRSNAAIKDSIDARDKFLKQKIYNELGLVIDQPKAGGSGTSNDGNTARRFFAEYRKVSEITGLDSNVLAKLGTFIRAIGCGFPVNSEKLKSFGLEVANLLVRTYPWYDMPQAVHKALIHGWLVVKKLQYYCIPVGMASEEAGETANKEIKKARLHHSRKSSRLATMKDIFHWRLLASDPYIALNLLKNKKSKKSIFEGPLPREVLDLLQCEHVVFEED